MSFTYVNRPAPRATPPAAPRTGFAPRPRTAGRPVLHLKSTMPEQPDAAAGQEASAPDAISALS